MPYLHKVDKKPKPYVKRADNGTYSDRTWRKFRSRFLSLHPLCESCMHHTQRVVPAVIVDHVFPHQGNKSMFWNNYFTAYCWSCHSKKTRKDMQGIHERYANGHLIQYSTDEYKNHF